MTNNNSKDIDRVVVFYKTNREIFMKKIILFFYLFFQMCFGQDNTCQTHQLGWKDCTIELPENKVSSIELEVEKKLDECSIKIGKQINDDEKGVNLSQGKYIFITFVGTQHITYEEVLKVQPSYLRGRYDKCRSYVTEDYFNFKNLEFMTSKNLTEQQRSVEEILEYSYLLMRDKHYLNYYNERYLIPKSLLRKYILDRNFLDNLEIQHENQEILEEKIFKDTIFLELENIFHSFDAFNNDLNLFLDDQTNLLIRQ